MKILTVVRTRNEEQNIQRFCESYQWTNGILVADGGSTDKTVEIAESMPKTQVREFNQRVQMDNGLWRNPEAEHLNFLTSWAEGEGADWILQDDCDCVPNRTLRKDARELLADTRFSFVYAVRVYTWTENRHFPKMAKPAGEWEASMWGWRADLRVRFYNTDMAYSWKPKVDDPNSRLNLMPPYCLLHDYQVNRRNKVMFYRQSGQIPQAEMPKDQGKLEELPEWAKW